MWQWTPHAAQRQILDEAKRYNVVACGRRFGKTELGRWLASSTAYAALPVGWFSPTYKDLLEVYKQTVRTLKPVIASSNKMERRIELTNGGLIEFWSLDDEDAGRGRKYGRAIIDEAAMARYLEYTWNYAIRPTLTDFEGDAWFLSTPKGRDYFYRLYQHGINPDRNEFAAWQMPTASNPYIKPTEIEAAQQEMPQLAFQQEYLAEFIEAEGAVFRRVSEATYSDTITPGEGRYVMGVDWAQQHDYTVLTVMDATTNTAVDIDRFNQIGWDIQRGRLAALAAKWGVDDILAEENSIGGPNIEALQNEGLPVRGFTTTNQSKHRLVTALQLAFEQGNIRIPDNALLRAELEAYEATRLPSGRWRYEAPAGIHDDMVMSLMLAYEAANSGFQVLFEF